MVSSRLMPYRLKGRGGVGRLAALTNMLSLPSDSTNET
jgi:hypothetical protein